jgi:NAD(P)-dependent dehydrogenase (short-subunit alcohol dehydrogenase family)
MVGICDGRVAIVTGAGRGIGRAEAVELARQGARVVVNDVGAARDGTGADAGLAQQVVDEIVAAGGEAVADASDISEFDSAGRLVERAVDAYGRLDAVVNNAGVLRDRMLVNMSVDDWDTVLAVHLRGTFAVTRHAAAYWRGLSKGGQAVDARVVNTSSSSGIYGNVGQSNYGAAKAGIAAFTVIAAMELWRYGVTVNAIAPTAYTRMTADLAGWEGRTGDGWDPYAPEHIAPLVAWLASAGSRDLTGRVFNVMGGEISVAEGWVAGPAHRQEGPWDVDVVSRIVPDLVARARPNSDQRGRPITAGDG